MVSTYKQVLAAEIFGTFSLVFAGTGAIVINDQTGGAISHAGIAMTFGLVVLAMIYSVGEVSGCHLNPAVTIGFYFSKRFERKLVLPYIFSQSMGALLASVILRLLFPSNPTLGATLAVGGVVSSLVLEILLTMILMVVILSLSIGSKEIRPLAGVVIGAVISLEAMFAGPISGASMNPARSFAPAIVSGHLEHLWLYLIAPVVGALLGVVIFKAIHGETSSDERASGDSIPTNHHQP